MLLQCLHLVADDGPTKAILEVCEREEGQKGGIDGGREGESRG